MNAYFTKYTVGDTSVSVLYADADIPLPIPPVEVTSTIGVPSKAVPKAIDTVTGPNDRE
jgi:hypothetical protein